jgi:hypothetical protein
MANQRRAEAFIKVRVLTVEKHEVRGRSVEGGKGIKIVVQKLARLRPSVYVNAVDEHCSHAGKGLMRNNRTENADNN